MEHSSWVIGFILGAVQGLTEFLPISSTGHLVLSGELLHFTGDKAKVFSVSIQLGSILAVVWLYWPRFWGLVTPIFASLRGQCVEESLPFSGWRGLWMLLLTTLPPSIVGLLLYSFIQELFSPLAVAAALAVGALCIFYVEWKSENRQGQAVCSSLDEMTPKLAFGIGCCQCLALWPGFSRSASTIMGGMLLGAKRGVAAEYSFIAAVPLMVAATSYAMLKHWSLFSAEDLPLFASGLVSAFLFALIAVKTFIHFVRRVSLRPFAWYRLLLAVVVLWYFY